MTCDENFDIMLGKVREFVISNDIEPDDMVYSVADIFGITINEMCWDVETSKHWPNQHDD